MMMSRILSSSLVCRSSFRQSPTALIKTLSQSPNDDIVADVGDYKHDIPRYKKINSWDKDNRALKTIGRIMSSKRDRSKSDSVVLEGVRLIKDALERGLRPSVVVFSREKLLWQLGLDGDAGCKLYHIPYNNIKMWTDLTTSPGIMAAFSKQEIVTSAVASSPLPLTLICDNIRTPDNLGSVIRVAAAAGARHVLCTRGCCDAWAPKVLRAGAGAHFMLPITENVEWSSLHSSNFVDPYAKVFLSDLVHDDDYEKGRHDDILDQVDKIISEDGVEACYENEKLCDQLRSLPLSTVNYNQLTDLPGFSEVVVVVGGETEGVSGRAHVFCHHHQGERLHVPLRNSVNSLNVISATSLVMFRVRDALEKSLQK